MKNNAIRLPDGSALPADVLERSQELRLSLLEQTAIAQLSEIYGDAPQDIISHVEKGITVSRVAECMRLRDSSAELDGCDIEVINGLVESIGFTTTDQLGLRVPLGKTLVNGVLMGTDEYEQWLLSNTAQAHSSSQEVLYSPHEVVIEALLESAVRVCPAGENTGDFLARRIRDAFDGDAIAAFTIWLDEPDELTAKLDEDREDKKFAELRRKENEDAINHDVNEFDTPDAFDEQYE